MVYGCYTGKLKCHRDARIQDSELDGAKIAEKVQKKVKKSEFHFWESRAKIAEKVIKR